MTPAFPTIKTFLLMGGYGFYVWLALLSALLILGMLTGHTLKTRRQLLNDIVRYQQRKLREQEAKRKMEAQDAAAP